jgi:hypothetical protein
MTVIPRTITSWSPTPSKSMSPGPWTHSKGLSSVPAATWTASSIWISFSVWPLAETVPTPAGKARFDAHKAQYDALNKIYGTYFSPGKAPSRACMAVEWIPGDSLIEIVGSALVVAPPTLAVDK